MVDHVCLFLFAAAAAYRLIDAMAEYHAIEDTLYYLDRAMAARSPNLPLDTFLRVS